MLSKFSDNLRMFQGKRKRQKSENVYIIEEKIQAGCQDVFQKSLKVFLKKYIDI